MKRNSGFTLIELVIVIIVIGILSATAVPKFINIQDDAKTATIHGLKAALDSAITLGHSATVIDGKESQQVYKNPDWCGNNCTFNYGYMSFTPATLSNMVNGIGVDLSDHFVSTMKSDDMGNGNAYITVSENAEKGMGGLYYLKKDSCYVKYSVTLHKVDGKTQIANERPKLEVKECD